MFLIYPTLPVPNTMWAEIRYSMKSCWVSELINIQIDYWEDGKKNDSLKKWMKKMVGLSKIFDEIMNKWRSQSMKHALFSSLLFLVAIALWRINPVFCRVKSGAVSWLLLLSMCGVLHFFCLIEESFVVKVSFKLILEEGHPKIAQQEKSSMLFLSLP